jgi:hypothetical protein
MTAVLAREVQAIQNPALGGVLLWRFAIGYATARGTPESTPLPALFLPLPILFHEETFALVASTQRQSGLRTFAGKFGESSVNESDVLLSLEHRARTLRPLSLSALRIAISSRLLFIETTTAEVVALSDTTPSSIPESIRPLLKNAEKLGVWCGGVTIYELSTLLHVGF